MFEYVRSIARRLTARTARLSMSTGRQIDHRWGLITGKA
jgi:hypothetical protein